MSNLTCLALHLLCSSETANIGLAKLAQGRKLQGITDDQTYPSDAHHGRLAQKNVQNLFMVSMRFRSLITPHIFRSISSRRAWTINEFTRALKALPHPHVAPQIEQIRLDLSFPHVPRDTRIYPKIASLGSLLLTRLLPGGGTWALQLC
ncbi:hypothetical protein CERZMDRAFT_100932 [Cercospora zeae-maydis SCOH1-5]|uniref:Uncharacterized protein n=1 Tax=Cercospora zeae-maydis SCOH1-5 TaxID=717836 RepID=A0A6A6F6I3_9PEZI|nr:hypothetical protein CERZMDRAFT_100932 [Cercospora zeae-maydis SCOH1-5]